MTDIVHAPGRFLAGIAALLRRADGDVLLLRRVGHRDVGAGVWECVTGRVNQGESFEEALHREVREETGLSVRVETVIGLSHFHRGDPVPANELQGIIVTCRVTGADEVALTDEHSDCRWVSLSEARELLTGDHPGTAWLRRVLDRAEAVWQVLPEDLVRLSDAGLTIR